jgi:hypothetical protein
MPQIRRHAEHLLEVTYARTSTSTVLVPGWEGCTQRRSPKRILHAVFMHFAPLLLGGLAFHHNLA